MSEPPGEKSGSVDATCHTLVTARTGRHTAEYLSSFQYSDYSPILLQFNMPQNDMETLPAGVSS
eukprot:4355416-Amphidinium_carterae.1